MLDFTKKKQDCTGCTACMAVCPVACIQMEKDGEGFLYPVKEKERCISCGLCKKVCPINQKIENRYKYHTVIQKAYLCLSVDYQIWLRSASGGAFSCICLNWGDNDTYVYGASWEGTRLYHKGIQGVENIAPLCKSKYVSSDLNETFRQILKKLKKGGKVIFCGTPCQVAGLRSIIPSRNLSQILLIDLICHGNGSMDVFQEALKIIGKQAKDEVIHYDFRAKRKYYEQDYISQLTFKHKKPQYITNDQYMQLFLSQNCLRPCCAKYCRFRDGNRPGDITLADGKGLRSIFPQMIAERKNFSTVVTNTAQGEKAIGGLNRLMKVRPYDLSMVVRYNPLFSKQTWFSEDRDKFFNCFVKDPQLAIKTWTKPYEEYKANCKKIIFNHLPNAVRKLIACRL